MIEVVLSHTFFWMCSKLRGKIYQFLVYEDQKTDNVLKDFRNEKGQPIYILPLHFVRWWKWKVEMEDGRIRNSEIHQKEDVLIKF